MQDLDNIVESLEKNIRRSLDKISNLQIKNNELQDELILLKNQDAAKSNLIVLCEEKYKSLKIANTIFFILFNLVIY